MQKKPPRRVLPQRLRGRKQSVKPSAERLCADGRARWMPGRDRHVPACSLLFEFSRRLRRGLKDGASASVCAKRNMYLRRTAQKLGQNGVLCRREIRKAVQIKNMLRGIVCLLQKRPQAFKPRHGVAASVLADGEIALIQQRQLLKLLRKLAADTLSCLPQCLRRQAVAQKLLHCRAKPQQKFRLCADGGVVFEPGAHLLGGEIDTQQPPALVKIFLAHAAVDRKQAACQPREAQDLGAAADGVASRCTKRALCGVGILLRHDQDLPLRALCRACADASDQCVCILKPVRVK